MRIRRFFMLMPLVALLMACSSDSYDTGDGSLSYMVADFVEAETDASAKVMSIVTDRDERLWLTRSVKLDWAEKPDTAYRSLIYYNKVKDGNGQYVAEPVGATQVPTPAVTATADIKGGMKTDPVVFESAWKSHNGKYINLDLSVKTGTVDGEYGQQTVGMACDGIDTRTDGTRLVRLTLYHDQASVPEYYSAKLYMSIPMEYIPIELSAGDEVQVSIVTYGGQVVKTFGF